MERISAQQEEILHIFKDTFRISQGGRKFHDILILWLAWQGVITELPSQLPDYISAKLFAPNSHVDTGKRGAPDPFALLEESRPLLLAAWKKIWCERSSELEARYIMYESSRLPIQDIVRLMERFPAGVQYLLDFALNLNLSAQFINYRTLATELQHFAENIIKGTASLDLWKFAELVARPENTLRDIIDRGVDSLYQFRALEKWTAGIRVDWFDLKQLFRLLFTAQGFTQEEIRTKEEPYTSAINRYAQLDFRWESWREALEKKSWVKFEDFASRIRLSQLIHLAQRDIESILKGRPRTGKKPYVIDSDQDPHASYLRAGAILDEERGIFRKMYLELQPFIASFIPEILGMMHRDQIDVDFLELYIDSIEGHFSGKHELDFTLSHVQGHGFASLPLSNHWKDFHFAAQVDNNIIPLHRLAIASFMLLAYIWEKAPGHEGHKFFPPGFLTANEG
jgi:hypothetical protein